MSACMDCVKTRGPKQVVSFPIHALSGEPGTLGTVSLCVTCLVRRDLFCETHRTTKMCFSDLTKKDGWGKTEILGACPSCALEQLHHMDGGRKDYLAGRFWQKEPALSDSVAAHGTVGPDGTPLVGNDAVVFALLVIALMYGLTTDQILESPIRRRLH